MADKTSKSSFFHKFLYLQDYSFQEGCYLFRPFTSHSRAAALASHSRCTTGPCSAEAAGTVLDISKLIYLGGGLTSSSFSVSKHPEGCHRRLSRMRNLMHAYRLAFQSLCLATVPSQGHCNHSLTDSQEIPMLPVNS